MSGPECCSNPPSLNPIAGSGHVDKIGALNAYIAGSPNSNSAVLLVSDVFGYEAPNFRKLADKVAAAGYYVVVPDFLNGEPFNPENPNKPWPIWIKDHGTDKGFEDAKLIVEIIKSKGVSSVAAAGFCWGAKVVTELAKAKLIEVVVLLHPSLVSLDDIKGVDIPISILGAEIDRTSPPELVKQFEEILAANSVTSFVKIFPKVSHGWTVRYKPEDAEEVKAAEEAHQDLLDWFSKHLKPTELLIVFQEQPASLILQQVTFRVFEAMEGYKRWVRQNKEYVHSLESLANGLTWLLPERFSESEIGPEAVTTVLGIVTAINEHIIDSAPDQNITGSVEPNSFPYPLCLSALKDLETLVEVVAQHYYGDDRKWNFLAVTEGIKVLVRLSLFRKSGYKMLLHGGETSNDDSTSQHQIAANPKGRYNAGTNPWNLEARALSALSQFGEKARMVSDPVWLRRVQHQQAIVEPAGSLF